MSTNGHSLTTSNLQMIYWRMGTSSCNSRYPHDPCWMGTMWPSNMASKSSVTIFLTSRPRWNCIIAPGGLSSRKGRWGGYQHMQPPLGPSGCPPGSWPLSGISKTPTTHIYTWQPENCVYECHPKIHAIMEPLLMKSGAGAW